MEILYMSQEDVIAAGGLDMSICFEAIESALGEHALGRTVLPYKTVLRWGDLHSEETDGRINAMPAFLGGEVNLAGIKWVGSSPLNRVRHDLPRASAILILNDKETKLPIAIMEATIISAMRTGAAGGVAAKYLGRKDSKVCGLIGAGVQARTQAMAIKIGLPHLERFIVCDLNHQRAEEWCREMEPDLLLPCLPAKSIEMLIKESDVFVTATTSNDPFVKAAWIQPGQTEIHIGHHEDEFGVLNRADKIIVDDWKQTLHRLGQTISLAYDQGLISDQDIAAELGQVISGQRTGRDNDDQFIYFNAIGLGIEDIALGARLLENAKSKGLGRYLSLWLKPHWV